MPIVGYCAEIIPDREIPSNSAPRSALRPPVAPGDRATANHGSPSTGALPASRAHARTAGITPPGRSTQPDRETSPTKSAGTPTGTISPLSPPARSTGNASGFVTTRPATNPAASRAAFGSEVSTEPVLSNAAFASQVTTDPVTSYLSTLAPSGRQTQAYALAAIAAFYGGAGARPCDIAWEHVTYAHANSLRSWLVGRYAPATARRMLAALRGVVRECWRLGRMNAEQMNRAFDTAAIRGTSVRKGRALTPDELAALFTACDSDPNRILGVRDAAILSLAYGAGLRRAEIASLQVDDYDHDRGNLVVVHAKGSKSRSIALAPWVHERIGQWLCLRGIRPESLVTHVAGNTLGTASMSGDGIRRRVIARAAQATIAATTTHDLRRTAVTELLEDNDPLVVSRILGHSQIQTTLLYDRRRAVSERAASTSLGSYLTVIVQPK